MIRSPVLGRRSLMTGLAAGAFLTSLPALADTPQLGATPITGTLTGSGVSGAFIPPTYVPPPYHNTPLFSLSATFAAGVTGSVTVERSTDGGGSWSPFSTSTRVISSLTTSGILNFQEKAAGTLYRLRAQGLSGNVAYTFQQGDLRRDPLLAWGKLLSGTGVAVSDTFADQAIGFEIDVGLYAGTTGSITVKRSTDNGATWNVFRAAKPGYFQLPVMPSSTPALYRLEASVTSGDGFVWSVRSGRTIGYDAAIIGGGPQDPYWLFRLGDPASDGTFTFINHYDYYSFGEPGVAALGPRYGRYVMTAAQLQALFDVRWTPFTDTDMAGDLTLYKVCTGNIFAKLLVPAAAKRGKDSAFLLGGHRVIRAEYVNVVSMFDANGNAVTQATSILDPLTVYKTGTQVASRDPFSAIRGYTYAGDFEEQHYYLGIRGFPTLREAAAYAKNIDYSGKAMNWPDPNLNALGL